VQLQIGLVTDVLVVNRFTRLTLHLTTPDKLALTSFHVPHLQHIQHNTPL